MRIGWYWWLGDEKQTRGGNFCRCYGFACLPLTHIFVCHMEVKVGFWPSTVEILSISPLIQTTRHFTLCKFLWKCWSWNLYTKSMTLCITWRFYIQKPTYFFKNDNLRYVFIYKFWTLYVSRFFYWIFVIRGWGGEIFICKKLCTFNYIFMQKQYTLRYVFVYKKSDTLCNIFICKKQCNLRYVYIYIIYHIVMIPNYKRTYDQSDQIEK